MYARGDCQAVGAAARKEREIGHHGACEAKGEPFPPPHTPRFERVAQRAWCGHRPLWGGKFVESGA